MKPTTTRRKYFGGTYSRNNKFKGHKKGGKTKHQYQQKKSWQAIEKETEALKESYLSIDASKIKQFTDFPLSKKTLQGLKLSKFDKPTEIQREAIGLALQGNDILGAAKTGSGKTLAFLIPVLECLYHQKWSPLDGLGALIISPTRELAYQTFEVLKRVGKAHDFSAGLVIGGKLLKEESTRINRTNIVVCTPGRLLQHMDETVNFRADSLQILILDEADRILDMGFAKEMNAIIENLPNTRQTLLFSATQTKSVKDLARLSLQDPMYVSVHENSEYSTPVQLEQNYIVCELHDKMNMLWSFIKNHLKSKVLAFFTSCKQVKYVYEAIKRLRPGVTVLALHGGMNQLKRVDCYNQFCRKKNAILIATDIAARGLDFPAVNWVLQMDCPEDANTYIHRVGRTARYEKDGESLLVLLPSEEEAMVQLLQEKKIPVEKIRVNPKKFYNIQGRMESNLAADKELKASAQRAFIGYLRSVFLMSNKKVFDVHKLDTDKYAGSLGLAIPPRVRFLKREEKRLAEKSDLKNRKAKRDKKINKTVDSPDEGFEFESKLDKLKNRLAPGSDEDSESSDNNDQGESNNSSDECHSESETSDESESSDNEESDHSDRESGNKKGQVLDFNIEDDVEDLFTVKRTVLPSESDSDQEELNLIPTAASLNGSNQTLKKKGKMQTKAAVAKILLKKMVKVNTKVVFDEEGEMVKDVLKKPQAELSEGEEGEEDRGIDIDKAKLRMRKEDQIDKQLYREKIKQKHKEERIKKKEKLRAQKRRAEPGDEEEEEAEAVLDVRDDEDDPLSYIPDPDKVYGPEGSDTEEGYREIANSSDEEEEEYSPQLKRRKMSDKSPANSDNEDNDSSSDNESVSLDENGNSDSVDDNDDDDGESNEDDRDIEDDEDEMDTEHGLEVDEAIAMKLLTGSI